MSVHKLPSGQNIIFIRSRMHHGVLLLALVKVTDQRNQKYPHCVRLMGVGVERMVRMQICTWAGGNTCADVDFMCA